MFVRVPQYLTLYPHNRMATNTNTACRKKARADNRPASVTMPKALQEAVIRAAVREDRSFSAVVRRALEQYCAKVS